MEQEEDKSQKELPEQLKKQKKKVIFTNDGALNTQEINYSGSYASVDVINTLEKNIQCEITRCDEKLNELELEIIGIDAPIANALRRIMIAEVPTMAIHKVIIYQNTSIIPDEVLAHRLGLLPVKVNPKLFIDKQEEDEFNEKNSINFTLKIKCERRKEFMNKDEKFLSNLKPEEYLTNTTIFSKQIEWTPIGNQKNDFSDCPIKFVHDEIIVAKLRENQEIQATMICQKGTGKQHAKWSPVCTAYYRLMPDITLVQQLKGDTALYLKKKCPMQVFDIEDNIAVVKFPKNCTVCRECIRDDPKLNGIVELGKKKDHYLFTIESVGIYHPFDIFREAINILKQKAKSYKIADK